MRLFGVPFSTTTTTNTATSNPPPATNTKIDLRKVGKFRSAASILNRDGIPVSSSSKSNSTNHLLITAGLPLILFVILSSWVVGSAVSGKLKEYEVSQGRESKSIRQARMEAEHDEMMERLQAIVSQDFENKRIKRPEEILEERRLEREKRNKWYRRLYRWITRTKEEPE